MYKKKMNWPEFELDDKEEEQNGDHGDDDDGGGRFVAEEGDSSEQLRHSERNKMKNVEHHGDSSGVAGSGSGSLYVSS